VEVEAAKNLSNSRMLRFFKKAHLKNESRAEKAIFKFEMTKLPKVRTQLLINLTLAGAAIPK